MDYGSGDKVNGYLIKKTDNLFKENLYSYLVLSDVYFNKKLFDFKGQININFRKFRHPRTAI